MYRKDRLKPIVTKVNIEEYDKKQSSWNDKRATMIAKVAKVQALREAFPAQLGAMYTQEEQQNVIDVTHREVIDKEIIEQNDPTETETEQPAQVEQKQINFKDL